MQMKNIFTETRSVDDYILEFKLQSSSSSLLLLLLLLLLLFFIIIIIIINNNNNRNSSSNNNSNNNNKVTNIYIWNTHTRDVSNAFDGSNGFQCFWLFYLTAQEKHTKGIHHICKT